VDLTAKKVAILIESDSYEYEIWYYRYRFAEESIDPRFVSRLRGQPSLTFTGPDYKAPLVCENSVEATDDPELDAYSARIVPSVMVADRLRSIDVERLPPATDLVRGRRLTSHDNLHGDAIAYGAIYVDESGRRPPPGRRDRGRRASELPHPGSY
jgi:protease I